MEAPLEELATNRLHQRRVPCRPVVLHRRDRRAAVTARHHAAAEDIQALPGLEARRLMFTAEGGKRFGCSWSCRRRSNCRLRIPDCGFLRIRRYRDRRARAVEARASREFFFEQVSHRAAEVHLIGQLDAQVLGQTSRPAADTHELSERQQLLLVREVIARAIPIERARRRVVERPEHHAVDAELGAQAHEVVELVHVAAHRHEHEVHVRKASAAALGGDQPPQVAQDLRRTCRCAGANRSPAWRRRARCRDRSAGRAASGCCAR